MSSAPSKGPFALLNSHLLSGRITLDEYRDVAQGRATIGKGHIKQRRRAYWERVYPGRAKAKEAGE